MKKRLFCLALAIVMVFSLLPASVFAAESAVTVTVAGTENYTYAAEVAEIVNSNRADNGASALSRNATLSELAMQRAAEIALYYQSGHLRPDDTACSTIIEGVYTGWTTYGENIAIGQGDPTEVMEAWMNSEGHRANILDTEYTQIGVGCFYADGVYCWVQVFSNSTTNTETTSATGSVVTTREISILPANLDLAPSGEMELDLEVGESTTLAITTTNPGFPYMAATLIPQTEDVTDADGNVIASVTCDSEGTITVTRTASGSGSAEISVYAGQTDPLTLRVTDSTEPQPTEPDPTEPGPSEPETPVTEYSIEVYSTDGGSAYVSTNCAREGQTFSLYVYPDQGYVLDQIYYYTDDGSDLQYEWASENEIYVVMPASGLVFEVYFTLSENPFVDVSESAYYYEPVLWAVSNGITSGVSANRFGPNNSCTRAQVVTFLWRTAGSPDPVNWNNPFVDVSKDAYYYKAVLWAVENGITSGVSENQFGPNNVCTRAQVVTFLWRACGSPNPSSSYNPFSDVSQSSYYYNAVLWAVENGITSGVSDTRFGSGSTCTRAHVVTFLYKTFHG